MDELLNMTDAELKGHLAKLRMNLEDAQEERDFVLGQSGTHVSPQEIRKYNSEVERLTEGVADAEQALKSRGMAAE
jgi:hypothetical protein